MCLRARLCSMSCWKPSLNSRRSVCISQPREAFGVPLSVFWRRGGFDYRCQDQSLCSEALTLSIISRRCSRRACRHSFLGLSTLCVVHLASRSARRAGETSVSDLAPGPGVPGAPSSLRRQSVSKSRDRQWGVHPGPIPRLGPVARSLLPTRSSDHPPRRTPNTRT